MRRQGVRNATPVKYDHTRKYARQNEQAHNRRHNSKKMACMPFEHATSAHNILASKRPATPSTLVKRLCRGIGYSKSGLLSDSTQNQSPHFNVARPRCFFVLFVCCATQNMHIRIMIAADADASFVPAEKPHVQTKRLCVRSCCSI